MAGASIETTREIRASPLRDVKARMRPLFGPERVAASANAILDGLDAGVGMLMIRATMPARYSPAGNRLIIEPK